MHHIVSRAAPFLANRQPVVCHTGDIIHTGDVILYTILYTIHTGDITPVVCHTINKPTVCRTGDHLHIHRASGPSTLLYDMNTNLCTTMHLCSYARIAIAQLLPKLWHMFFLQLLLPCKNQLYQSHLCNYSFIVLLCFLFHHSQANGMSPSLFLNSQHPLCPAPDK